jgi:hypothetical protein
MQKGEAVTVAQMVRTNNLASIEMIRLSLNYDNKIICNFSLSFSGYDCLHDSC